MAELIWQDDHLVDVAELDRQHQTVIALINELNGGGAAGLALEEINDRPRIQPIAHEEDFLERFDFKHTEAHLEEHVRYIETIARLTNEQIECIENVQNELIQILNRWWTDYILRGDKKYTRTFSDNNGLQ